MEEALTTGVETPANEVATQGEEKWYSSLSEEYRNHPSIQKFTDVNGMAKSYLSLESMMGQEKIPVPKNADDANAWALYNKAFGVPETSDAYDFKVEGFEDVDLSGYKDIFHKHHLSNDVANDLIGQHLQAFVEYEQQRADEIQKQMDEASQSLKKEWGYKYEENLKTAHNFLQKMSDNKEDFDYFNEKIGNDAKFIKLLTKLGNSISEGELGGFEGQVGGFTKTPAEAKAEFDRIMNDPNDAYWAGSRNKRNDIKYAKEHNLSYVSEDERRQRVNYVQSLMEMMS